MMVLPEQHTLLQFLPLPEVGTLHIYDGPTRANTPSYNFCPCYIFETNCSIIQNYGSKVIDDAVPGPKKSQKITDFFGQVEKGKLSKAEIVEKDFEEEISDHLAWVQTFVKGLFC